MIRFGLSLLMAALESIESRGRNNAIGDNGKAFGCLQIHYGVVDDVNRIVGYRKFILADARFPADSEEMFLIYIGYYATAEHLGHEPTPEDVARIWNGGPDGWRKDSTLEYWHSVEALLK